MATNPNESLQRRLRFWKRAALVFAAAATVTTALNPGIVPGLTFHSAPGQVYYRTVEYDDFTTGERGTLMFSIPGKTYDTYRGDGITRARILLGDDGAYASLVNYREPLFRAVANSLRQVAGSDDELFADLALQLAHQFYYNPTFQAKSAVETFVEGSGDCDPLVAMVASILKADGMDVVMLLYKPRVGLDGVKDGHMQLGVALDHPPVYTKQKGVQPQGIQHEGRSYFIGEATMRIGFNTDWRDGWLLGQVPLPKGYSAPTAVIEVA